MTTWPLVPMGDVISFRKRFITIHDDVSYKRCRVQVSARGIVLRDIVTGADIKTKEQQICAARDFLVAEIDAKHGGYGIVPPELDSAIVSNHYFLYTIDESRLNHRFLDWFTKTPAFFDQVAAQGSTNYAAIRPHHVLEYTIPCPMLDIQCSIADKLDGVFTRLELRRGTSEQVHLEVSSMLSAAFQKVVGNAPRIRMADVAPLAKRSVEVDPDGSYPELGIRSFGKGTFHKPALNGIEVGTKRLFAIHNEDLLFNIVFAWEGAVAVAQPEDHGRVGSHRFLTCVADPSRATAHFLRYYFLTPDGLLKLGEASPGGAGRNRTLSQKGLDSIQVPLPSLDAQHWFNRLQEKVASMRAAQASSENEASKLIPALLDRTFSGDMNCQEVVS